MNKFILKVIVQTAFCILLSLNLFSQIYKNQWLIGGNANFSYSKATIYNNTVELSSYLFSPSIGYFFLNRFAGGLLFDLGSQTYNFSSGGKYRISSLTIGPVIRYYFLSAEKSTNIFLEGAYGLSYSKNKFFKSLDNDFTNHYSTLSFKAGPAIFLNEHTALEITIGYNHSTRGPIDTAFTNTLRLGIGFQIHFSKSSSH